MKRTFLMMCLALVISGCGSDPRSEIEKTVHNIASAAEERDIEAFMSFLSFDYTDDKSNDRAMVREMVHEYFQRYRGISVNILDVKIVKSDMDNARVITEVNFSIGFARVLSKIVKSYGETYRFHLSLKRHKKKGWQVGHARWEWVPVEELYPESIKVLKELFPDTF